MSIYTGLLIAVSEMFSTILEGKPNFIILKYVFTYLNIGLTPFLAAIPITLLGKNRMAKILSLIPGILNLCLLFTGQIFNIGAEGTYARGPLFWTFPFQCMVSMIYLTRRSFAFSSRNQNHNEISLLFISLFMISSTTIQMRLPQIHLSWFCVTVTILLYFIYYVDTIHKMDSLTNLLNRNAFLDDTRRCRHKLSGILMIDLDNFKHINDTYGHLVGDQCLIRFGGCLCSTFEKIGYCYRLGGDEFCILLDKTAARPSPETLTSALASDCERIQDLPEKLEFSYGYQTLDDDMTIERAFDLADRRMYSEKLKRKKRA